MPDPKKFFFKLTRAKGSKGACSIQTVICNPSSASLALSASTFSNDFSSETTGPISIKFHIHHSWQWYIENLFKWSRSHGQDGHNAYIQFKSGIRTKIFFTPNFCISRTMKWSLKTLPDLSKCIKHSQLSHEITPSVCECRSSPAIARDNTRIRSSFQVIWSSYLDAWRQYVSWKSCRVTQSVLPVCRINNFPRVFI